MANAIPNALKELAAALNAASTTLRRSTGGLPDDWAVHGKNGHIYPDGNGFWVYAATGESKIKWNHLKTAFLPYCRLAQDGDDEGAFHLAGLPDKEFAIVIRKWLGIRKRQPPPINSF